jgi:hypothetical protein
MNTLRAPKVARCSLAAASFTAAANASRLAGSCAVVGVGDGCLVRVLFFLGEAIGRDVSAFGRSGDLAGLARVVAGAGDGSGRFLRGFGGDVALRLSSFFPM